MRADGLQNVIVTMRDGHDVVAVLVEAAESGVRRGLLFRRVPPFSF